MHACRFFCLALLLFGLASSAGADDRKKSAVRISEESFRRISSTFLNEPLSKSAPDYSRLIMLFALDSSDSTAVFFGGDEWSWTGLDSDDSHALLLLAAYSSGNALSQLNSGVKRNDRYSGLLTLFRVYRVLQENAGQEKKKAFKITAVDKLLELHRQNKLLPYLQELDKKQPTKWTRAEEATVRKLMKIR